MKKKAPPENKPAEARKAGQFPPGVSGNPGGRPKKLREIEAMLDAEFRTVEGVREAMTVLRKLAVSGVTNDVFFEGCRCGEKTEYSPAYMEMYLCRILGPVKEQVSELDLSGMSDAALEELRATGLRLVK